MTPLGAGMANARIAARGQKLGLVRIIFPVVLATCEINPASASISGRGSEIVPIDFFRPVQEHGGSERRGFS
jgi:hypothetical protein